MSDERDYEDSDRPRRRRRNEEDDRRDDDDYEPRKPKSNPAALWSLILGLLSFCLFILAGIPAIILGIMGLSRSKDTGSGSGMAITGIICGVLSLPWSGIAMFAIMLPAVQKVREAATRQVATNNVKQIGLATLSFQDEKMQLPTARYDPKQVKFPTGKGLSWRVGILPYLEEKSLHDTFNLSKSWDDPANTVPSNTVVIPYSDRDNPTTQTRYQAFVGRGTAFDPNNTRMTMASIADGTSNTILFVEANATVPWAAPQDLPYTPNGPLPKLGRDPAAKRFVACFCDGSVHYLRTDIMPQYLQWLIQTNDGNVIPPDAFD